MRLVGARLVRAGLVGLGVRLVRVGLVRLVRLVGVGVRLVGVCVRVRLDIIVDFVPRIINAQNS